MIFEEIPRKTQIIYPMPQQTSLHPKGGQEEKGNKETFQEFDKKHCPSRS